MVLVARHPFINHNGLTASISSHSNEWISSIVPVPNHRTPYTPNSKLKGLFAGSGNGAMSQPFFAQSVIDLTNRPACQVNLLYIGTASYDIAKYREIQTSAFVSLGCQVNSLDVAHVSPLSLDLEKAVDKADVILVSGGNTLYAMDRWRLLGLDELMRDAASRGTVMAGGSAGCICWFDGGHSDSMDPDTYRLPMMAANNPSSSPLPPNPNASPSRKSFHFKQENDSTNPQEAPSNKKEEWSYIRVPGLSIFPGLLCPHYDRVQSNGIPRMFDFDEMMSRHPYELGLGIDHYAALVIDGEEFRVLSLPGAQGSVVSMPTVGDEKVLDETRAESLVPGAWIKYVDEESGSVVSKVCPSFGKVEDLLQAVIEPDKHIWIDARVEMCRTENPGP